MIERPAGLVFSDEINLDEYLIAEPRGHKLPFPGIDEKFRGFQPKKLWAVIAGTGIGKSFFLKEIVYHLLSTTDLKIAHICLEEDKKHTVKSYLALDNELPFWKFNENPDIVPRRTVEQSANALFSGGRLVLFDHFGSLDGNPLLSLLDYLVYEIGVDLLILDHITIAISGVESSREGERKDLDRLTTYLKTLTHKTKVTIIVVSQLKQINDGGKSFDEGRVPGTEHIRSSGALSHLSDFIVALSRNKRDESQKTIMSVHINKNRYTSMEGLSDVLYYMNDTGRLIGSRELNQH